MQQAGGRGSETADVSHKEMIAERRGKLNGLRKSVIGRAS
jgi:hypothetical protein